MPFPGQFANANQAIRATGGTIDNITGFRVHSFTNVGTTSFVIAKGTGSVNCLVVAGGASGARYDSNGAGGGGAGGYLEGNKTLTIGSFTVTVGAGGATRTGSNEAGQDGGNSVFDNAIALGGGGGGASSVGRAGGSGGGGGNNTNGGAATQGNSGGLTGYGGAGRNDNSGGGAAGAGGGASAATPALGPTVAGAAGRASSITGNSVTYAAGGGVDYISNRSVGISGAENTGNGGMGMYQANSGAGGSGIVIVRYAV
jgi:hypothetical protein